VLSSHQAVLYLIHQSEKSRIEFEMHFGYKERIGQESDQCISGIAEGKDRYMSRCFASEVYGQFVVYKIFIDTEL
jgi:hypothetical protein